MTKNQTIRHVGNSVYIDGYCIVNPDRFYSVKVGRVKYEQYKNGGLIQRIFPHLDDDQREWIISGIHPDSYDELFREEQK